MHAPELTVHLAAIRRNWALLAKKSAPAECAAVVKANAYGLGLIPIAQALWQEGARFFFVAHLEEALELRAILPRVRIAVLNGLPPKAEKLFIQHDLIPVLNTLEQVGRWNEIYPAILHIDTGMNRLGISLAEAKKLRLSPTAIMSHFVAGDRPSNKLNDAQYRAFNLIRKRFPDAKASLANSAGILNRKCYNFDLTRPGCALYGINPRPSLANPMENVVTLTAPVLQVHTADANGTVGYGASARVKKGTRLATIGIGYADGYLRSLSDKSEVVIGGKRCKVLGRVSMDLIVADVTKLPESRITAQAEIIGANMPVDKVAKAAGTIGYEIFTRLGNRLNRHYKQ